MNRWRIAIAVYLTLAPWSLGQSSSTLWALRSELAQADSREKQESLEKKILQLFAAKDLENGTAKPKVDGLLALWATTIGDASAITQLDGQRQVVRRWPMVSISSDSKTQVLFQDLTNFSEHHIAMEHRVDADTWSRTLTVPLRVEVFPTHPDSIRRPDVPSGKITKYHWKSLIFKDTARDFWVYVPAQYKPDTPACLMVFQDGEGYVKGIVPTVFDNLIHRGELPIIVGVFINPGEIPKPEGQPTRNRSVEYDTLSDAYARFLRDEIVPEVCKTINLRTDANSHAIAGRSSGGICAFTAAWEMPDQFGKVMSSIGSFTNIRGGDAYPGRIRKTPAKPIRVFLQDGRNDLDNEHGNWWLANQQMAKALAFKNYDNTFITGDGFHSGKHEAAIMPDALRWLWRDWRP